MAKISILFGILLIGLAASLPMNKRSHVKKNQMTDKLGELVEGLLKKPEMNSLLDMFKGNSGAYNFDLNMLLENGEVTDDGNNEKKENVLKKRSRRSTEDSKRTQKNKDKEEEEGEEPEENKEKKGTQPGMGMNYMSFIPGGFGGSQGAKGSKSSKGAQSGGGMMNYMSFIPGSMGRKKRSASMDASDDSYDTMELMKQYRAAYPNQMGPAVPNQMGSAMPSQMGPSLGAGMLGMQNPSMMVGNAMNTLFTQYMNAMTGMAGMTGMPGMPSMAGMSGMAGIPGMPNKTPQKRIVNEDEEKVVEQIKR